MSDVFKRLNWALLLSHKIYGGPPPDSCRRAWYKLFTISMKLNDRISYIYETKLDESLQAMYDHYENDDTAIVNSLQNMIEIVTSESGSQITKADADVVVAAAQELIRTLCKPAAEQAVQSFN